MMKRLWAWIFLGLTAFVVGLEIFAAVGPPWATSWTQFIVAYVPFEVAVLVFGALVVWLPVHFYIAYRRRRRRS